MPRKPKSHRTNTVPQAGSRDPMPSHRDGYLLGIARCRLGDRLSVAAYSIASPT
jgi:hypothetical protein